MAYATTYVTRPNGLQTTLLVNFLFSLNAEAVLLDSAGRAHEATFAIVKVPGPIRRCKSINLRKYGPSRHFRIVNHDQDYLDCGLEEKPKWAENARIVILLQDRPFEYFRDPANRAAFLNAMHEMHYRCVTRVRTENAEARRKANQERRAEEARKQIAEENSRHRTLADDLREYWGSNLVMPAQAPAPGWFQSELAD